MQSTEQNIMYKGKLETRMAWTFGKSRMPVLCTLLGDEPLFTISERPSEDDLLDEIMLALELDAALDSQMSNKDKLPAMEKRMAELQKLERAAAQIETYKPLSSDDRFNKNTQNSFALGQALADSNTLNILYRSVCKSGIQMVETTQVESSLYQKSNRTVFYNPQGSYLSTLTSFATALRSAFLDGRGGLLDPLTFLPEDAVILNRLFAADSAALTMQIAWEMNLSGKDSLWLSLLGSSGYDLAVAYARAAIQDFRNIENGKAAQAVVEAWFFSGRCRILDQNLIREFLARPSQKSLLGDGYLQTLGRKVIATIGERVNSQNYLSSMVNMLLSDPLYTDVRDRSSANFMWFLKFEREFQNQEQKLAEAIEEFGQVVHFPKMNTVIPADTGLGDTGLKV